MSVLVIGGDRLGNIKDNLKNEGFDTIKHITGRKSSDRKIQIPENMDVILVLTDFINHKAIESIKIKSKKCNAKILYSKRSWVHMEEIIKDYVKKQNK
ncbi:hypothetical protein BD780_000561 [Clostridium tetanomorphum]|uniref:DUF2325 domain-containing protein n=1 Tax=Clostridium tetanomorphum TaxID=1553 RepID=A0A923EAJ6_CLOTT|nr:MULTISPECIES: DUF2325 domain-containing protein [Clostridium]KAJ51829.1 hypothetical protein CTM_11203 [Clostridium tetanomorphum DSM 665]MBC2397711.1 DUF2325 domain-containing protein [Clostridium tetanomorphum]MBC2425569.1 DUF2325 domain-containing protein [Clostridium beijerinckii]MBP1865066.1 hypothetical protein [Clostridium tetanomorphum]NRS83336.1 hypothetical protein [Clostridium tetanomorphum]